MSVGDDCMAKLKNNERIEILKKRMLEAPRYASIEQARIITRVYKENEELSTPKKRALSLAAALRELEIGVEPEELIVGNRTKGVRYGVVFPESGCSWIDREFETLPTRDQDKFLVRDEDIKEFRETIYPYWKGRSMEDVIRHNYGEKIDEIAKVVKINQKDHAQGHICPDTEMWLRLGVNGLIDKIHQKQEYCKPEQEEFYECTLIVLDGVKDFMKRYHDHIYAMLDDVDDQYRESLQNVADICLALTQRAPETFHEAFTIIMVLICCVTYGIQCIELLPRKNGSIFVPILSFRYCFWLYDSSRSFRVNGMSMVKI